MLLYLQRSRHRHHRAYQPRRPRLLLLPRARPRAAWYRWHRRELSELDRWRVRVFLLIVLVALLVGALLMFLLLQLARFLLRIP